MSRPRLRVVGLGPGDARYVTASASEALLGATVARLRTRVHPAAASFAIESYDDWYDSADSFESLYARIVEDLVALAHAAGGAEVVYAVPGSPVVAERTVELLRAREDIEVVLEPAVSVIDVACATLGVDPMSAGLRIVDALESAEPFRGPGPLLILQTYLPEVLATVADRLAPATPVDVLFHLGLDDERVVHLHARELTTFVDADHLTSLYVEGLRGSGEAMEDLVSFTRRLRAECPWDQDQTHASLTRYLIEESYEALDALNSLATMIESGEEDEVVVAHAEEELGDLLFQVLFHAELGDEEGRFNLASIADTERDKLTERHPHVFGDVVVRDAADVAANWEVIKQEQKGRTSVLDGVSWWAPALALQAKVLQKSQSLAVSPDAAVALDSARTALSTVSLADLEHPDPATIDATGHALRDALEAIGVLAARLHLNLEGLLRERVLELRDQIVVIEAAHREAAQGAE